MKAFMYPIMLFFLIANCTTLLAIKIQPGSSEDSTSPKVILSIDGESIKRSHLWVQVNNGTAWNNVPRSNTQLVMRTINSDYVTAVPFVFDITTNEKFRIMWAGDDASVFMNYMTNTSYAPETPSIIMTVSKISEITP